MLSAKYPTEGAIIFNGTAIADYREGSILVKQRLIQWKSEGFLYCVNKEVPFSECSKNWRAYRVEHRIGWK